MSNGNQGPANLVAITSPETFMELMQQDLERVTLLNFWASWAAPCESLNEAMPNFAKQYPDVMFMNVEAEEQPEVAESFDVEAVPTIVLLRGHTLLAKTSGSNVSGVADMLSMHARSSQATSYDGMSQTNAAPQPASGIYEAAGSATANGSSDANAHELPANVELQNESQEDMERRCHQLMSRSKVMLFMKGHPSQPRCGFSQKTVALLREQGVEFDHYDILSDDNVRQTLKKINQWPTFPQIIVNGELIGGLDILKEQIATGELGELLSA